MATFKVKPEAAARAEAMIAHHNGDIAAAAYDISIGLQSLGGYYTDRKSERVLEILRWLQQKPAETLPKYLGQLHVIAAKAVC